MTDAAHTVIRPDGDAYWTPPEATASLLADLRFKQITGNGSLWDPAAGAGWMVMVMRHLGRSAFATDLHDHGGVKLRWQADFLLAESRHLLAPHIVGNPPFHKRDARAPQGLPLAFVSHALAIGADSVWLLCRHNWDEGIKKSHRLEEMPWAWKLVVRQRFAMWPYGRPPAGKERANPPHNYAWYGFVRGHSGPYQCGYVDLRPDLVADMPARYGWSP